MDGTDMRISSRKLLSSLFFRIPDNTYPHYYIYCEYGKILYERVHTQTYVQ